LSAGEVVVIGGGVAGIAAALDCADAGARVTLVEVRPRLGGAAYSFRRDGLVIDNGQHVFLRCCGAYRALLERLGSSAHVCVQRRLRIPVLSPGSEKIELRRGSLPAPLHLAGAIARYRKLSPGQRLGAARAGLALARLDEGGRGAPPESTLGEWLAARGQDADTVSALWDLIALPTLNLPAAQASLALGAFVFRTGLLSTAGAGDIGFHVGTLSQTIGEPAGRALERAGVEVRLGWRAERLAEAASGGGLEVHGQGQAAVPGEGERVALSGSGGEASGDAGGEVPGRREREVLSADATILAVPHARAATLLEPLLPGVSRGLSRLGSSPIVNLHVVYDRMVCEEPFAAGVKTPVQYLFDRSAAGGARRDCQYLAVSLSAAEREMRMSVDALRECYMTALRELLPRAREAKLESFLVTREHAATFRAGPGVAALRPGPETSVPGLYLAGAWTDTGWPATLEGAVRSGHSAASSALAALGIEPTCPGARVRASSATTAAQTARA
jgi:squalene-associated FAD-dependent desaturase